MAYQLSRRPQLVAHMGYSAAHPANTVRAATAAVEAGADMVEIDVSVTSDGHAVAIHGPKLETTTTGSGRVSRTSLATLREASAYHRDGAVSGWGVPEVAEIVRGVTGDVAFNFDLKAGRSIAPLLELIWSCGLLDRSVISGATAMRVMRVRRRRRGVGVLINLNRFDQLMASTRLRTWWLTKRYRRLLSQSDVFGLNLHHRFVDPDLVAAVHAIGAQVWTFTVDKQPDVDRVVAAGVDSITTNRPGELDLTQTDL